MTAARDLASVREARANGVRHYLVKPFTASALRERLDEVLHHHTTLQRSTGMRNSTSAPWTRSSVAPRTARPAHRPRASRRRR